LQLDGDLVGGAVPAQPHDRVVDHRPLRRAPHPGGKHVHPRGTVLSDRSALVRSRHPSVSTTRSSRIPPPANPGTCLACSALSTTLASSTALEPGLSVGTSCVSKPSPWPVR